MNGARPVCCTAGLSQTPENNRSPKSAPLISNLLVIREYRHENRIYWLCLIKRELTGEGRTGERCTFPYLYFYNYALTFWTHSVQSIFRCITKYLLFSLRPINILYTISHETAIHQTLTGMKNSSDDEVLSLYVYACNGFSLYLTAQVACCSWPIS